MTETFDTSPAEQIVLDVADFVDDPLGFVYFIFPWSEGGLKDHKGPDQWQRKVLEEIG